LPPLATEGLPNHQAYKLDGLHKYDNLLYSSSSGKIFHGVNNNLLQVFQTVVRWRLMREWVGERIDLWVRLERQGVSLRWSRRRRIYMGIKMCRWKRRRKYRLLNRNDIMGFLMVSII
jgi:hypothetical protein